MENVLKYKIGYIFFLSILLVFLLANGSMATPFQNGSFESPESSADHIGAFYTLEKTGFSITGWEVFDNNVDWVKGSFPASSGVMSIDLNGTQPGGIEQTFDTTIGQTYEVLFDMAANPGAASTSQILRTMKVSATGNTFAEYSFNATGKTTQNMGWTTFAYQFSATGISTTLQFLSTTISTDQLYTLATGPALDNVRVKQISNIVPEPATLLLLGFGLLGLAGVSRKKD